MKKIANTLLTLLAMSAIMLLNNCSKDEETVEPTSYCYIDEMTLGTLTRYETTTEESGETTTYPITYSGSYYPMEIDQINGTITNTVPLLLNTDRTIVPLTIEGEGNFYYRPLNDENDWYSFTAGDYVDFSTPVVFRAAATDGKSARDYIVTLTIRNNDPEGYTWEQMMPLGESASLLEGRQERRIIEWKGGLAIFSKDSENAWHMTFTSTLSSPTWTDSPCTGLADADIMTLQSYAGELWMSTTSGTLLESIDGLAWEPVQTEASNIRLLAGTLSVLYAYVDDIAICQSPNGKDWFPVELDEDISLFPTTEFTSVFYMQENKGSSVPRVAIAGIAGSTVTVWNKIDDDDEPWALLASTDDSYALSWESLPEASLVAYSDRLIAIGNQSTTYQSTDNGLTWWSYSQLTLDENKRGGSGEHISATASGGYIWIAAGPRLWRARINSYGE